MIVGGAPSAVRPLLARVLSRVGLWPALARLARRLRVAPADLRIVIKPDLAGFSEASPTATGPAVVETMIDLLGERGYTSVAVVAAADSSALWTENRDVLALAELLGYRFVTPKGRAYDVVDLSQDLVDAGLSAGATLCGTGIARAWSEAHVRIIIPKNRTDEARFYALALDALIGVLPCVDKDYQYRHRREPGDVIAEILSVAPPHLVLIDALRSAHGSGGLRAPLVIETGVLIAATDAIVADCVGALKMGVDPWVSPTFRRVIERTGFSGLPQVDGSLAVYEGWTNVKPVIVSATAARERWVEASRLVRPWLQHLDPTLFPLKNPLDARINASLAPAFRGIDDSPAALWLLALSSYGLGTVWRCLEAWRVLYAKDGLRRIDAPLGLDLRRFTLADYEAAVPELLELSALLEPLHRDPDGLRWRDFQESVLFDVSRIVPVGYDDFVERVDVSRTIQFMNDYIGGTLVPIASNANGQVTHQAERNLYLPQPNYLILSQGKPIDVTKLEFCEYGKDFRRMFWKTIRSENDSARYDDGIVTFSAHPDGTRVTIFGRQLFVLPPFWKAVQLELAPEMRALLVTEVYATFFRRTLNNLEAVFEGRDVRIGRPWFEARDPWETEPLPVERLGQLLESPGDGGSMGDARSGDLADSPDAMGRRAARTRSEPVRVDGDGFAHFHADESDVRPPEGIGSILLSGARELFGGWIDLMGALGADISDPDSWIGEPDEDSRDGGKRPDRRKRGSRTPGSRSFGTCARAPNEPSRRDRRTPD